MGLRWDGLGLALLFSLLAALPTIDGMVLRTCRCQSTGCACGIQIPAVKGQILEIDVETIDLDAQDESVELFIGGASQGLCVRGEDNRCGKYVPCLRGYIVKDSDVRTVNGTAGVLVGLRSSFRVNPSCLGLALNGLILVRFPTERSPIRPIANCRCNTPSCGCDVGLAAIPQQTFQVHAELIDLDSGSERLEVLVAGRSHGLCAIGAGNSCGTIIQCTSFISNLTAIRNGQIAVRVKAGPGVADQCDGLVVNAYVIPLAAQPPTPPLPVPAPPIPLLPPSPLQPAPPIGIFPLVPTGPFRPRQEAESDGAGSGLVGALIAGALVLICICVLLVAGVVGVFIYTQNKGGGEDGDGGLDETQGSG